MTGFGGFRGQDDRLCVAMEVRSVNNRYFKIIVKSPERFQPLEGEIERVVREGEVTGDKLKLRMTLTSENTPALKHIVEATIDLE